jgi:hypothetical protein
VIPDSDPIFILGSSARTVVPVRDGRPSYTGSLRLERPGVLTFSLYSPRPVRIWIGRHLAVDDAPQRDRIHIFRRMRLAVSLPLPSGEHPVVIEIGARSRHIYWLDVQNTSYYREGVLAAVLRRLPDELTFEVRVVPDAVGPAVCVRFEPGQFRHEGCVWQDLRVRRIAGFGPICQPWSLEQPGDPVSWTPQLSSSAAPGKTRPVACWENRPADEVRVYVPVTAHGEEPPVARTVGRDERPEPERTVVGQVHLTVKDPSGAVVLPMPVFECLGRQAPKKHHAEVAAPVFEEVWAAAPQPVLPPEWGILRPDLPRRLGDVLHALAGSGRGVHRRPDAIPRTLAVAAAGVRGAQRLCAHVRAALPA